LFVVVIVNIINGLSNYDDDDDDNDEIESAHEIERDRTNNSFRLDEKTETNKLMLMADFPMEQQTRRTRRRKRRRKKEELKASKI
jgi:hypothetical protein